MRGEHGSYGELSMGSLQHRAASPKVNNTQHVTHCHPGRKFSTLSTLIVFVSRLVGSTGGCWILAIVSLSRRNDFRLFLAMTMEDHWLYCGICIKLQDRSDAFKTFAHGINTLAWISRQHERAQFSDHVGWGESMLTYKKTDTGLLPGLPDAGL